MCTLDTFGIRHRFLPALGALGFIAVLVTAGSATAGAASGPPSVTIRPAATGGKFIDQQVVEVSVGPNSTFVPHSRVVILECADPGGDSAHLPTSLINCDENTIQPDTTVVQADGSFVEAKYTLYALPNSLLGEQANWQPVCNLTNSCVLFVGENQNDFTEPKVFSTPFLMTPSSAAPLRSVPASAATDPVSPAVSLSASELAFTGLSQWLLVLAGIGLSLVLLATLAARRVRRSG